MVSDNKNNLIILLLSVSLICISIFLPFSIYGQDGYHLWFPIIAEYLNGDKIYHASNVIFDGQNLGAIYGELPFWKLFRVLIIDIVPFLNLTYAIFCLLFLFFSLKIVKGLKKEITAFDISFIFLFSCFAPTIFNRALAGHLNLQFGVLPFFILTALIFSKDVWTLLLSFFGIWFALSTQSYQILAYHIFYVPLLFYLFWNYESEKRKYLLLSFGTLILAFIVNLPQFLDMYQHAHSENSLRTLNSNQVYSYLISQPSDILNFFVTSLGPTLQFRPYGYFHEVNYGMGCFLFLFIRYFFDKKLKIILIITGTLLFLFCMNAPGINLLAELPVLKAFRVPQRSFMILSLFLTLWTYGEIKVRWQNKDIAALFLGFLLAQVIPSFEILGLLGVFVIILMTQKEPNEKKVALLEKLILLICLCSLFAGIKQRIHPSIEQQKIYTSIEERLGPLFKKYSKEELRTRTFHFESANSFMFNYVAQSLGIRTIEGYGHPPLKLLQKLKDVTQTPFNPMTNSFFLPSHTTQKEKIFEQFDIDIVVKPEGTSGIKIEERR